MRYRLMRTALTLVIPCYNESQVFGLAHRALKRCLGELDQRGLIDAQRSRMLFVDDGSRDTTWACIQEAAATDSQVAGLKLSGNRGHQNALLAGLEAAASGCDAAISIDADLQDDIAVIPKMLESLQRGSDIVYGVRKSRGSDKFLKKNLALSFYRLSRWLGLNVIHDHADFRLMSNRAITALLHYPEKSLFLRGLVPMLGYTSDCIYYDRLDRAAGFSKYPVRKSLALAIDGITSLSIKPLRIASFVGIMVSLGSVLFCLYAIQSALRGNALPGWLSVILFVGILGGFQLCALGIIGEYIGKIYMEVKRRPRYHVETTVGLPDSG
jgi:polyisoprenyl-phosphate glycosyltransferase